MATVPFVGCGVGMVLSGHFCLAYASFVLAALWVVFSWFASDWRAARKKAHAKANNPVGFYRKEVQNKRISPRVCDWIVVALISAALIAGCVKTKNIQDADELRAAEGLLVPANDPPKPNACKEQMTSDYYTSITIGTSTAFFKTFPHTVFSAGSEPLLWLTKDQQGRIGVNADIRGPDLRLVIKIRNNKFTLKEGETFSRDRPNKSTLRIVDAYGNDALSIRFSSPTHIDVAGAFYYPGMEPAIFSAQGGDLRNVCLGESTFADIVRDVPSQHKSY